MSSREEKELIEYKMVNPILYILNELKTGYEHETDVDIDMFDVYNALGQLKRLLGEDE